MYSKNFKSCALLRDLYVIRIISNYFHTFVCMYVCMHMHLHVYWYVKRIDFEQNFEQRLPVYEYFKYYKFFCFYVYV